MSFVKPSLPSGYSGEHWNVEELNIPALEWAGRGHDGDYYHYEFIGNYDALIALGCAQLHMLAVGRSGRKSGRGYETQALANNRFRLELHLEQALDVAELKPKKAGKPDIVVDPISLGLKKTSILVRKYPHEFQSDLYKRLCEARGNGWQLIESFPWLAVRVFVFNDQLAHEAIHLVRQGAKTREIAEYVNVPMCFKRFAATHQARLFKVHDLLSEHTDLVRHHCPNRVADQGSWLSSIHKARSSGSSDFAIWVAVHWPELVEIEPDRSLLQSKICDLRDWVRACVVQRIGSENVDSICQITNDEDLIFGIEQWWAGYDDLAEAGKPFNRAMSPQTVIKLSDEWHERQAVKRAADLEFPEPWYEGGMAGSFRMEPVRTAAELSQYAYHLHNCATFYAHDVANGSCFIYVVFEGDELKAMLDINRARGLRLGELKGLRNSEVSAELRTAVDSWWQECKAPAKSIEVMAEAA